MFPTDFDDMSPELRLLLARAIRAELPREEAWTQGDYRAYRSGTTCFCLLGAGVTALCKLAELPVPSFSASPRWGMLEEAPARLLREAWANGQMRHFDIVQWNDARERTWTDIDALLDHMVKYYEAEALQATSRGAV